MNFNNTFKLLIKVFGLLSISIALNSCLKEEVEPPRSMEEIYNEEGLPVTVEVIETSGFTKELSFYANLEAAKESHQSAMVNDKIIKINKKLGDYVEEDEVVIEFPTDNPSMQYDQAKVAYENAKKTFERMKGLLQAGEISQQMYDDVETNYYVSKRNFESIKQMLFVEAPIKGRLISLPYKVGEIPEPGSNLFTVAQLGIMIAKINVSDKEIGQIKLGMKAIAKWNDMEFEGRVSEIPLTMNQDTKSFQVEVSINNPKNILKSGILTTIELKASNNEDAIVLNRNLINRKNDMEFVYIAKNGYAMEKQVETGATNGLEVQITSGLMPKDTLINCCSNLLENGKKIRIKK